MTGKKTDEPCIFLGIFLAVVLFQILSCAAKQNMERETEPLLGQWITDRNIVITISVQSGSELTAEITSAPGFYSTDLGAGSRLIQNIQPLARGKYSGLFSMPGKEQPIKVQLNLMNHNTIVVETGDRRAKGNKMLWRRVTSATVPKP